MGFKFSKGRSANKAPLEANRHDVAEKPRDPLAFDPETLPWIDRLDADINGYLSGRAELTEGERELLRTQLFHWRQNGFLILKQAIEPDLIDAYLNDLDELLTVRHDGDVLVNCSTHGCVPIRELSSEELEQPHLRFLDFHNASTAGKRMAMAAPLINFLRHALGDRIAVMQSLTFLRGSQQSLHQDFAYVVAQIPSHLAGGWIALEDVHPDAGPVGYYRGSHRLPRFDFGTGPFLSEDSTRSDQDFSAHIKREAEARQLPFEKLTIKSGDVLIWHGSLAHCGTPVRKPELSRKSVVFHYSTVTGYPRDRRRPDAEPKCFSANGAHCFGDPIHPELENTFTGSGPW